MVEHARYSEQQVKSHLRKGAYKTVTVTVLQIMVENTVTEGPEKWGKTRICKTLENNLKIQV